MTIFGPSDRYYDPPESIPCCSEAEDDPHHDTERCLYNQAEYAAERRADERRDHELNDLERAESDVW